MSKAYYKVKGGNKLKGSLKVAGAKNAALKMIVASTISSGITILKNVPNITDVEITLKICEELGSKYEWIEETTLKIDNTNITSPEIPVKYSGSTRTPILFVPPLLHRLKKAIVSTMGGCSIGPRQINYHIDGLKKLGVNVVQSDDGSYEFNAHTVHGNVITLEYPSVGATENLIMAAVGAKGRTVIKNAAIEPEILNLVGFLQAMGAIIYRDVNRTWIIEGIDQFKAVEYEVIYDRIEAASFAALAVATQGDIFVEGAMQNDITTFLNWLRKAGGAFDVLENGIRFYYDKELTCVNLETDVHPGFMTDWQPPFGVLLTQAKGISVIHETVYENRFGYVDSLIDMGAEIQLNSDCLGNRFCRFSNKNYKHSALISGKSILYPSTLQIPDLRAGFAYIMAALIAEGESNIYGIEYVERGYADLIKKLKAIGADIDEFNS